MQFSIYLNRRVFVMGTISLPHDVHWMNDQRCLEKFQWGNTVGSGSFKLVLTRLNRKFAEFSVFAELSVFLD